MIKYEDDKLSIDEIGDWALHKYSLISQYAKMFATSMKDKWECRVYLDLFSSSGFGRIKSTSKIVATSSILSLDIPHQFDKYIFCDIDGEKINSLKQRVKRLFPKVDADFFCCDSNESIDEIIDSIPTYSREFRVLSFCVLDPYKIDNLAFTTISKLSNNFMDFLILIPSFMDVNRNVLAYFKDDNDKVERFLGYPDWRTDWRLARDKGLKFGNFFVSKFNDQMCNFKFLCLQPHEFVLVRHTRKKIPLYHLAFYSKHRLGKRFWNESRQGPSQQLNIFDI